MRMAECHSDRKHVAHGLCRSCYYAKHFRRDKGLVAWGSRGRPSIHGHVGYNQTPRTTAGPDSSPPPRPPTPFRSLGPLSQLPKSPKGGDTP